MDLRSWDFQELGPLYWVKGVSPDYNIRGQALGDLRCASISRKLPKLTV